ncbi:oligosaccharide flippase family protein [Macrococcus equipercicus]|uniref:Oligosaccharide flippase family protein n=1 Tax=Macrococcus equipercicus TaxID=69967 RepID=A0ABQ6R866_9STAP|nr:oligosaccharide flippase family protein [Macrococcus equipercicus]KAA1039307.1 oligosaccharide flippase family protein [Macrococcus equipercicus]
MNKKNFLWMFIGTGLGAVMSLLMNILLARSLTKVEFGIFGLGITFINISSVIIGFGLADFIVKIFAVEGRRAYRYVTPSLYLFLISCLVSILIIIIVILLPIYDISTRYFLLLIIPNILLQGIYSINNSINQIEENFKYVALSNFLVYFIRFLAALLTVISFNNIISLGWYIFILSMLGLYPLIKVVSKLWKQQIIVPVYADAPIPPNESIVNTFKQTYPFGFIGIFYFIYYQSNIIMLSILQGPEAVGEYNSAFIIVALAFMFPDLIFRRMYYTRIHTWATHNPLKLQEFNNKSSLYLLILGIAAMIFIWLNANWLILFTAGPKYLTATFYLQLLSIAILFKFFTAVNGTILSTQNMVYTMMKINGLIAILNITINIIIIPIYGVKGAVVTTLISEGMMALLVYITSHKYLNRIVNEFKK